MTGHAPFKSRRDFIHQTKVATRRHLGFFVNAQIKMLVKQGYQLESP
jgi:hypothetical protein